MSKSNLSQSRRHNPTRKKNDARYERVLEGYRLVAMQAKHVDEIARAEGRPAFTDPRCPFCFLRLRDGRTSHFCRWKTEKNRHLTPVGGNILRVPVYKWRLKG